MMSDELNGAAEAAADDSVHADLAAAFEQAEQVETPAETQEPPVEASEDTQSRDEKGRFAAREAPQEGEKPVAANEPEKVETAPTEADKPAEHTNDAHLNGEAPPPGWSIQSKGEWDKLPEHIRGDIAKREREVNQGLAKLQEFRGLDPYVEMARSNGRSLDQVMKAYTAAEDFLTKDPINGILWLCQNYGINPDQLSGKGGDQAPKDDPNAPLNQRLNALENQLQSQQRSQEEQRQAEINSQIEAFRSDPKNRYFDNVRQTMAGLLQTGQAKSMEDAYEQAMWAHPELRAQLIQEQRETEAREQAEKAKAAASKAKQAAKSIATGEGSPEAANPNLSLRDEIAQHF